jgi:ABC-2 type transport system ATP-binding protein
MPCMAPASKKPTRPTKYVIQTKSLVKKFGTFTALNGIDLKIKKGEFFGCFGPNGAGKTTLLKILTGQLDQNKGISKTLDIDTKQYPIEIKKRVGIVPESESPPSFLTPSEYLYFVGRIHKLDGLNNKVDRWLDFFNLHEKENTICRDLSKGMRQKLMLAAAFIHESSLLFLDEPFINLDPIYQRKVKDYLVQFANNGGTVFMCTHILEIAEKLCSRVAIMDKGRVIAEGSIDELRKHDKEDLDQIFLRLIQE